MIKIGIDFQDSTISAKGNIIYMYRIFNQSNQDIKNIMLNFSEVDELLFVGGYVKRKRGIMEMDDGYIDLGIGNLAPQEAAKIVMEFKLTKSSIEMKDYSRIVFVGYKNK